jgi:hypothetical protein
MLRVLGVMTAFGALAAAAWAANGPTSLRLARPADATPRSGAGVQTQEWQVLATDARTHSSFLLTMDGIGSQSAAQLSYWPTVPQSGYSEIFHDLGPIGSAPGFSAHGLSLSYASGQWTLVLDQGTVQAKLTFAGVVPGAAALGWPVGGSSTFNWAVPVAAARVTGSIDYGGHHAAFSGWHGLIDHTWGKFDLGSGLMQHWDWAAVAGSQGAWIVDGFETGAGITQWKPHDAQWNGVLIHAGAHSSTFCRARVVRGGWRDYQSGLSGYVYPQTLTASCNGMRVRFARSKNVYALDRGWAETSATSGAGDYGLFIEQNRVGN